MTKKGGRGIVEGDEWEGQAFLPLLTVSSYACFLRTTFISGNTCYLFLLCKITSKGSTHLFIHVLLVARSLWSIGGSQLGGMQRAHPA